MEMVTHQNLLPLSTGYGKLVCYAILRQVFGITRGAIAIMVSPLIITQFTLYLRGQLEY